MFAKYFLSKEAIYELKKNKKIEQKINRDDLIYKTANKYRDKAYDFQKLKTITSFGKEISRGNVMLDNALEKQVDLQDVIDKFKNPREKTTKNTDS